MVRILIFALLALSQLSADSTMTWAAPTQISSSSINATSAEIATDSSGNMTSLWVENGNIVTKSLPFGGSWGSLTTLDSAGTASSPLIGMANGGDAVAVWLRAGVVEYATLSGGTWTIGSSDVSSSLETASNLKLYVDSSGNAIAIWQNSAGAIEVATRLAGGSWSAVTTLSASGSDSPSVAIGNGSAVAVWHNITGTTHILQYSTVATLGGSWSAAGSIYTSVAAFPLGYPKVTVDSSGNATVVAYRYEQSGSSYVGLVIVSSTLVAGGSNWSVPSFISNIGQTNPANLALRVRSDPNGNLVAMWMQSTDGSTFSFNANAQPFGGNWSIPVMVSLPGFTGTDGYLHINSIGDYVAVFMANDGTNALIQSSDFFYGGFLPYVWSPLSTVSTGTNNGFPRVASYYASGTIYATAVWTQYDGTNTIINAATGSRVMLLAPSNLQVTQNLQDYGIVQDYYNTITWTPSTDTNAVGQVIFRNGVYLVTLSKTDTSFVDHNQPQSGHGPVVYGIAAVNEFNQLSPITTLSFP